LQLSFPYPPGIMVNWESKADRGSPPPTRGVGKEDRRTINMPLLERKLPHNILFLLRQPPGALPSLNA
jgi:hypothetical protein